MLFEDYENTSRENEKDIEKQQQTTDMSSVINIKPDAIIEDNMKIEN